jgi:hypothetical protein
MPVYVETQALRQTYTTPRPPRFACIITIMSTTNKPKRQYNKMTPAQIAQFKALEAVLGNGSAAVRALTPTVLNPGDRAFKLRKKAEIESTGDFINDQLQQIGVDAVNRLGKLVNSTDEKVATKNVQYAIDRLEGKPMQRSESKHLNLTIETVLE